MESHESRSARVKLQLRDKKGRWIEMGSHIKWFNLAGQSIHGIAVDSKGEDIIAEVDSIENQGQKTRVAVNHKKVEVIDEKANLDAAPVASPDGTKQVPGEVKPEPVVSKYASTPGPTQIVVKTKDNTAITSLLGTLKVGDKVYPIGTGMKPYSHPTSASGVAFKKHTSGGVATITAIKEGKYATITDANGKQSFSSLKHYAVKQTPELDKALYDAHQSELAALKDGGVGTPSESAWISALNPDATSDEQKAALPAEQAPAPAAPETPSAPAPAAAFDASKSAVGDKVTLPDGEATKTADNTWKIPGKGNALSDGQVNTYYQSANGNQKPLLDAPAAVEPDVKVTSNHKAFPGSVRVAAADDKSPIVVPVSSLKVGDKIYPITSLHNKPYGDHGNYNPKSAFVHTNNPAGTGTVVATSSNYATVEGSDGKTYYPTNNFVALKSTPGLDKKIEDVKATFDAPEQAPETPAAPEAHAPEPEAPAAPAAEAPAAPAEQSPAKKPIDISKWKKTGSQMGSNDGGVYTDENGKQWYVKKPASNEHAMNEVLADDLYKAAGIETSELQLADLGNGKLGTASPMLDGVQKNLSTKLASDKNYKKELQDGFAMDVLLANWDVVGLEFDNVVTDKAGKPVRVDPGGALLYRAMGSPKGSAFDKMASEWDTLRDSSTNSKSAKAFGDMTDEQLVESAKRVEYLTPGLIDAHVDASGFDDATKAKLKDILKARRENIIQRAKAITPVEEQANDPIGDAPATPAAPEPTPDVTPEPATPEPAPQAPEAPAAPAPEPQPEAPAAPAPQEEPAAAAPTPAPAPEEDPFAGLVLKDKGKTVPDANGDLLKVGTKVTHSNGKNGKGVVTIVYPSTNSAKVYYENGVEQVANGKLLTPTAVDTNVEPLVPEKLAIGEVFFDTATGKTHIGAKDGTPLTAGSKVSYTKKGVTQTGTVKGIYKGQQTVNIDFEDGTNSTKKASALTGTDEHSANAPEAPAQDTPDVTPTPEATPEAPAAPEPDPVPAPAEPASLDGKVNPTADDLNALPVGAKITSDASQSTYVKNEDGKWAPETGDHGPYHTNMMVDGDKVAHGYKVDLSPDSASENVPAGSPEAPTTDAPKADAPVADAPEAPNTDLKSFEGKKFSELTPEQMDSVPVGTKLVSTEYGHYWQKESADKWMSFDKEDNKPLGVDIEDSKLKQEPFKSTHTLELPKESTDAPSPEAAPVDTPAPDAPAAEVDVTSLEGEKLSMLDPNELKALPVGTTLKDPSSDSVHIKKTGDDEWTQYANGFDGNVIATYTDKSIIPATKTASGKHDATVTLPKPGGDTPEAASPDSGVDTLDFPDNVTTLPVGTVVPARTGSTVGFKKTDDNKWEMTVKDKGIGQHVDDQFVQGVVDTTKPEIIKPFADEPSASAPEPEAPEAPVEGPNKENDQIWGDGLKPTASELPLGSVLHVPVGSWKATKTAENKWESSSGSTFTDGDIDGEKSGGSYKIYIPNVPEDAATEATPSELTGTWGDSDLQAGDLPVGTFIGTDHNDTDMALKKTKENEWLVVKGSGAVNGKTYPDSTVNGLKSYDGWKVNLDEHKALDNPTVDIPDPEATPAEATPNVPQSGKWSDGPSAADAPVGTKIIKEHSNYTITKTGDNTWESSSGTSFNDNDLDYFKNNKSYGFEVAAPLGKKTELNDAIISNFGDLPVGTKIYTGSAGWSATKDGPDSWVSTYGTDYSDQELIDSHNDGNPHFVAAPADYALPTGSADSTGASNFADFVGKNLKDTPLTGENSPIGTVLEFPGSMTGTLTKVGDNDWKSADGNPYWDSTVDGVKTGGGNWKVKSIPGAETAPGYKDGDQWNNDGPFADVTAADLPVGAKITSGSATITKTGADTWAYKFGTSDSTTTYHDSDIDGTKSFKTWTYLAPEEAAPATPAPASVNQPVTLDMATLSDMPDGTKIVSESGYTLKKGTISGVSNAWIPLAKSGQPVKFKDGDTWASPSQLMPSGTYFPNEKWTVHPPGTEIPDATGAPATPSVVPEHHDGMQEDVIHNLPDGSIMVATSGSQKGYIMKVSKATGGTKLIPLDDTGNNKAFVDGVSYAAPYEVGANGVSGFNGDYDIYPAGTTVTQIKGAAPASAPTGSSVSGVLHSEMGASEMHDLPDGSLMVAAKGQHAGYIFKVQNPSGGNAKLIPLDKETGHAMSFTDGDSFAAPYEVENGGPVEQWQDNNGDFTVYPPGTAVADISGAAPAAPAGPEAPTGAVGSATNPAVVSGKSLNTAILNAYPKGTTIKKESNSSYPSEYYFIKNADGTWDMKKKGKDYHAGKTSEWVAAQYFSSPVSTGTVHQPKPYSKSAVLGTGEIVYAGDTINYKGDVGYIKSITNAGAINVQVNGKSGYKAASTLSKNSTHGLKTHIAQAVSGNTATTSTPSHSTHSAPSAPATVTHANFAGANADDYNASGVTVKGIPAAPTSGLTMANAGPVDKSNPLYGADKPSKPAELDLGHWDSAEWLKKVEERYNANPNKAKATVQQSGNWNSVQNVLNGQTGSLDSLLQKQYIDQAMFDEATAGIKAKEEADKPLIAAHDAEIQNWVKAVDDWTNANPSATQHKPATMPEVSKESFEGGPADWSKAHVGTYSADNAIAAIKADAETATHGISVATDSTQIEDLDVRFQRNLDVTGQEVLDVNFKVTPFFATELLTTLKGKGASVSGQIFIPKFAKDSKTGLMKDTATSYSNSMAYSSGERAVWTDPDTGAKVTFNHGSNSTSLNPHTLSNGVRIQLPKDATSATYQKVLENLGINAKPATEGDIKVFGENQFITTYTGGALHDFKKNLSGEERQKALDKIKAKFGITPDDMYFGVDSNGWSKFMLTEEATKKLLDYSKVSSFRHALMGSGSESEQMFGMITGANPGLSATYQRWTNGIHASGMSSSTDIGYGSGDFMFTRSIRSTTGKASGTGVHVNPAAALKRIDLYGNPGDNYGKKDTSAKTAIEIMTGNPASNHEIIFKHTIPLSEWGYVVLSGSERQKLIDRLKNNGITKINGIPLENFILTEGMAVPKIDPSVYSAAASTTGI